MLSTVIVHKFLLTNISLIFFDNSVDEITNVSDKIVFKLI